MGNGFTHTPYLPLGSETFNYRDVLHLGIWYAASSCSVTTTTSAATASRIRQVASTNALSVSTTCLPGRIIRASSTASVSVATSSSSIRLVGVKSPVAVQTSSSTVASVLAAGISNAAISTSTSAPVLSRTTMAVPEEGVVQTNSTAVANRRTNAFSYGDIVVLDSFATGTVTIGGAIKLPIGTTAPPTQSAWVGVQLPAGSSVIVPPASTSSVNITVPVGAVPVEPIVVLPQASSGGTINVSKNPYIYDGL